LILPKKTFALLLLLALLGVGGTSVSRAEESIWSALVLATNEEHPAAISTDIEKYGKQLKSIFGYNQYELLGQHVEMMNNPSEHWLIPSKDFFLQVESKKSEKPGFYRLKLDLYEEQKLLAGMEARLSGQNLLFIRGPFYGKGQLIIILMMK
jgi:hypothetical protein